MGSYSSEDDEELEPLALEIAAEKINVKQSEAEFLAMLSGMEVSGLLEEVFPFNPFGLFNYEEDWF